MARTYKAEGRQVAKLVRGLFAVVAMLLYGYAFPDLDRSVLVAILAVGWVAAELAAWWWVRRRRAAKAGRGRGKAM
ncbi:hypothetical protein FE782_02185 [Paenibacillus antri]|uniref:Uncharacterized protein n=1 Tax=Paenibacillus antri TaxID=2582848 RepID=A0A5R9GCH5_9BACL|nr:hypothetical protein [Paenibacillus antri]TLS54177.1 hypothetical protein FE782_02185 [Paenibacillus antri]